MTGKLSPLFFVLILEPFLAKVDRSPQVCGLLLPENGEVKVSAYADDITLCMRDTDDLGAALRIFETYGSLSGARLNEQRSAVLWVNRPPDPSSSIPAKTSVPILGVTYRSSGVSADMWTRLACDIGANVHRARAYALPLAERR